MPSPASPTSWGEIASASDEQSRGIDQVGQAVAEMDRVTQQNASLVEESASAAAALEEQASRLTQSVAVFRLKAEGQNEFKASANSKVVTPVINHKKMNASDPQENWETFNRHWAAFSLRDRGPFFRPKSC
ncbi:Serine chemoreceptor protein [Serratia fonticola]|uniref:Serine chemoreceptor protein n=1 Tax=Serratia fonticola TaxID=47917 RepID=A0A4U9WKB5_SERFO|nr:Serine chemoreceptor protein [Serratia fonticola]